MVLSFSPLFLFKRCGDAGKLDCHAGAHGDHSSSSFPPPSVPWRLPFLFPLHLHPLHIPGGHSVLPALVRDPHVHLHGGLVCWAIGRACIQQGLCDCHQVPKDIQTHSKLFVFEWGDICWKLYCLPSYHSAITTIWSRFMDILCRVSFHTSIVIPLSKLALSHLSLSYPVLLRLSSPFGLFRSSSALYLFFTYVSFTAKDIMYVIQQRTNTSNHQNK